MASRWGISELIVSSQIWSEPKEKPSRQPDMMTHGNSTRCIRGDFQCSGHSLGEVWKKGRLWPVPKNKKWLPSLSSSVSVLTSLSAHQLFPGPSLAVKPTGAPVRVGDKEGQGHREELTSYFMSHTPAPLLHLQPQHVLQLPRPHGQLQTAS